MLADAHLQTAARPRIGPNAVIQLAEASRAAGLEMLARRAFDRSGHADWFEAPPGHMIDEAEVAAVHEALWREAEGEVARRLVREAGVRTADYVIEHRIPAAIRRALELAPPFLAEPMLLSAIRRHAWTFAGSGQFCTRRDGLARFGIRANPLASALAGRCVWHEAVFTRMWQRLVSPLLAVQELSCCGQGQPCCRFRVGPA